MVVWQGTCSCQRLPTLDRCDPRERVQAGYGTDLQRFDDEENMTFRQFSGAFLVTNSVLQADSHLQSDSDLST